MKYLFITLFIFTTLSSFAQDTLNFAQLKFKKLKKKEFLVDAKWNYKRTCALPAVVPQLFADLDTNELAGELLIDQEWERLHLNKEEFQQWDTIEKCGKVTMGNCTAYIVRYKNGSQPQHVYLYLYNDKGIQTHILELANHEYGESGSSCLFSFVRLDNKNNRILILNYAEMEGWVLREDEYREDGTVIEGDYCTWWNSVVRITSINMQTLQIEDKTYYDGGKECE